MKIKFIIPFIILFIFQLYMLNNHFYSISADESAHTLDAYNFKLFGIWLPFQRMFLHYLLFDLFWTPRIISMIIGHLALASLMLVSKELFKDGMVTLLTGVLGALFVGIAVFSVLPLTEIYFFLFVLLSIYFLLKKSNWIYLTVILMTMTRYEGWLFALVFLVILIYRKSK